MRAVIQRVKQANVTVEDKGFCESIGAGFAVLLGVGEDDTDDDCRYIASKIAGLRVFEDAGGKMNLSLADIDGEVLIISQFTLYGDCRKGRRPSFIAAAPPDAAVGLYERVCNLVQASGIPVAKGLFGEHMLVKICNDGPVTLLLDSNKQF